LTLRRGWENMDDMWRAFFQSRFVFAATLIAFGQASAADRHWSFVPIAAPSLPAMRDASRLRGPIDNFVQHRLEAAGHMPALEADRYNLIRRLSLDLLGLLPDPDRAAWFDADSAPDAYERLVDQLLSNPHFGERWGRHWLDQARYADSDGYEVDKARPDAYRWRDWVIEAVNRDIPLDEFTILQFAGDLLPEAGPRERLATAYHRQTFTNNEGGVDKEEYRFKAVQDRVSNTATVWLGLTLGCAQCHDHPYDPFTQREFYELAAIFNNADEVDIELADANHPQSRSKKFAALTQRDSPRSTRMLNRGDWLQPGDEVQPGFPSFLHSLKTESLKTENPSRLDLARWLIDPANPLTPRVMANQIWLHLFGAGLVRTADDFGTRGQPPTHPELLDWLASELLIRETSRKALIRQIVNSATYRQSSHHRPELAETDPLNGLLARQNRFRVEGEVVRDIFLEAGGLLSGKIGGPSVYPPLSPEFIKITFRSELPWKVSPGEDRYRRGMYTFFKRSVPYPDLMIFDCPDASLAAIQRPGSNTPLQAFTTLNGETYLEAARGLAARMLRESLDDASRIEFAFRACLARPPMPSESERLLKLHRDHRQWYAAHADDAATMAGDLQEAGFDTAEAAAATATANIMMNLDEFVTRD
jgi:hypothetical protein